MGMGDCLVTWLAARAGGNVSPSSLSLIISTAMEDYVSDFHVSWWGTDILPVVPKSRETLSAAPCLVLCLSSVCQLIPGYREMLWVVPGGCKVLRISRGAAYD